MRSGRLRSLDLLRFIAALGVVLYHYFSAYVPSEIAPPFVVLISQWARYGYLGVELFFIISGFVILWSADGRSAVSFVIARASRLYPTFWAAVLLTSSVMVIAYSFDLEHAFVPEVGQVIANLTMYPTLFSQIRIDDVYWTLELELRFYALVTLMIVFGFLREIERWLWVWLGICATGGVVELPGLVEFALLIPYAVFFQAGGVFYLIFRHGKTPSRYTLLALSLVLCVAESLQLREHFISVDSRSTVMVPLLVITMFGVMWWISVKPALLAGRAYVTQLGALTYPLYLTHAAIGRVSLEFVADRLGYSFAVVLVFAGSLALAYVLVVVVDRPAQRPLARLLTNSVDWCRARCRFALGRKD